MKSGTAKRLLRKCYGRLWICLDNLQGHCAILGDGETHGAQDDHSGDPFVIYQDESDGSTSIANVRFSIAGKRYRLYRPLNSREPWSLWCEHIWDDDIDPIEVFTECGDLSPEFKELIQC